MVGTLPVSKLHLEHRLWIAELNFYKEELAIFETHLAQLAAQEISRETAAKVEHFQNRFICQKEVIGQLKHDLNTAEHQLVSFVQSHALPNISTLRMDNHPVLRDEMATFRKLYGELKGEFRRFEAACL